MLLQGRQVYRWQRNDRTDLLYRQSGRSTHGNNKQNPPDYTVSFTDGVTRGQEKSIYHEHWEKNSVEDNFDDFLFGYAQESFESLPFAIQFEFSVWKGCIVINENAFLPANTNFLRLQRSYTYNAVPVRVYVPWQAGNQAPTTYKLCCATKSRC